MQVHATVAISAAWLSKEEKVYNNKGEIIGKKLIFKKTSYEMWEIQYTEESIKTLNELYIKDLGKNPKRNIFFKEQCI